MTQLFKPSRWLKFAALFIVPLLLYAVLAKRASWRPRILRYPDEVMAVAYSPDSRWLAGASLSKLEVRDMHTEQIVWQKNLDEGVVKALAFSPDGKTLAMGREQDLQLWDVPTHTLKDDLLAHYPYWHDATTLFFTPDSACLISGGDNSQALLWDTHTGKLISAIVDRKLLTPLALSLDARTLALLAADYRRGNYTYVTLWNLSTNRKQHDLRPPPGADANCAALSPDNKTLAMGTVNGQIQLWDIATGHVTRQFAAHPGGVAHLAFSGNGRLLVSSGYAQIVKLWDARTGALLRTLTEPSSINCLTFAPASATLAVACGQTVQLWRVK